MVCCVRMVTFCKTFWSKRVLQLWMHSLVLPCLSCKFNDSKWQDPSMSPRLLFHWHLDSFDIKWHLSGTAGTESLESFGSFGCACGGSFVLGSKKRQDFKTWRCMEHGIWMHLGSDFDCAPNIFPVPHAPQALVVGWSLGRKAAEQRGQFLPSQCSNTTQQRWAVRVMWIRISRLSWSSARLCKLSRQEKILARKWNREIIETQSTSSKFEKSHATSLQHFEVSCQQATIYRGFLLLSLPTPLSSNKSRYDMA